MKQYYQTHPHLFKKAPINHAGPDTYDAKNCLSRVQVGSNGTDTVTYKINALGQRVQKQGAGGYAFNSSLTLDATGQSPLARSLNFNARYVYDEQGRLIGEYAPDGKLISEIVWFNELPVATLRPKGANVATPLGMPGTTSGNPANGATAANANNTGNNTATNRVNMEIFYIHPDHLGTPRMVTRSTPATGANAPSSATATSPGAANKAVWRWDSDPFGSAPPNENPQGVAGTATQVQAASFRLNMRFPGQLADGESGKYYNYFRDYDPSIGRYTTSDPIGLRGGVNTYAYVKNQPMNLIDPDGLRVQRCCRKAQIAFGLVQHCWLKTDTIQAGMNETPQCSIAGGRGPDAGSGYPGQPVYVSDHSCDVADKCVDVLDIDENCVNRELSIGRPLGRFLPPFNSCQTFVNDVIRKCRK